MFSAYQSDEIVELLVATAHYHQTGVPLGLGHTVNLGKPWSQASNCDHGLISLPYLDGPELETLNIGSIGVKFYWLIPVTAAEVAFKKINGLEALEELFERSDFEYANPGRPSVVLA